MVEGIVLGAIQGITEWLPISSKSAIILAQIHIFGHTEGLSTLIEYALFLHIGTFLAAAWYLREDVMALLKTLLRPQEIFEQSEIGKIFRFLAISTVVSGVLGYPMLQWGFPLADEYILKSAKAITLLVGVLLLGTAVTQWRASRRKDGSKHVEDLRDKDGVLLGFVQALSALPGFSRSGFTVSALLLRGYSDITALRLSFLMSLPIVLGANIVLSLGEGISLTAPLFAALISSFLFGMLTIHLMFRIARKVNFAYFVFIFGLITIASAFV